MFSKRSFNSGHHSCYFLKVRVTKFKELRAHKGLQTSPRVSKGLNGLVIYLLSYMYFLHLVEL